MHAEAAAWVRRCVDMTEPAGLVVEFGSRNVNGGVRELFPGAVFVGVDTAAGPGVDVICDGADYTPDRPADVVVCTEVLEHTPRAAEVVANGLRILRPGGVLIVTAAGPGRRAHSAIDENPIRGWEHYENIDPAVLAGWLSEAADVEVDVAGFDVRAFARRPLE